MDHSRTIHNIQGRPEVKPQTTITLTRNLRIVLGTNTINGLLRIYFAYLGTTPDIKEWLTTLATTP